MAEIAIGVSKIEYGTVGDGVPAVAWTEITDNIAEGSVAFNFSDPTETNIMAETTDVPVDTILTKEDPEYIDFALISPAADTLAALAGGTASDPRTTGGNTKWEAPSAVPSVNKSIKLTTKTNGGYYYEYVIVNAKLVVKPSQAPAKKAEAQWLIRCYVQEARTAAGVLNTPYSVDKFAAA